MVSVLEKEIVDVNNCSSNYYRFVNMPAAELDALQISYYSELHTLQKELDDLLNELRNSLINKNATITGSHFYLHLEQKAAAAGSLQAATK